jgi:DNA-binding beta-propeller fold protein YncE
VRETEGAGVSSRIRLFLGLPGVIVLLIAVAAVPAAAFTQPGHPASATSAFPGARSPHRVSKITSNPPPRTHAPGLAVPEARFGFGSALRGSAPVGQGPAALAVNPGTHTIYVTNGENDNGPNAGGDTISVIDTRHCNAHDVSRCEGPWPTITVGNGKPTDLPSGIAIDQKTDTVYVANAGANTVSVFNGATCNAEVTVGCSQKPAEVPVGPGPLTLFNDPASHTVYIANCGSSCANGTKASTTVSLLDTATCNATDLADCPATPPPTVSVGGAPLYVDVNQTTHTAYVTTIGAHRAQNGWTVFNANTCNAAVQSGCSTTGEIIGNPAGPNASEVDPANDTLYTANYTNTVSAFDLRHCYAGDLAGCASARPGTVTPIPEPGFGDNDLFLAVDQPLHSVYVTTQKDAVLAIINTSVCNGRHLTACATLHPPTIHTGAEPEGVVLDAQTQTLYTANQAENDVSVIATARCNAGHTTGCRHPVPSVPVTQPAAIAADSAASTAYVGSGPAAVAMINTRHCSARHLDE